MYSESRQEQVRRWAKFPAGVLFAISGLWLVFSFFSYQDKTLDFTRGINILSVALDLIVVPVGGVVVGLYLLLRKQWAVYPAALIPLWPLINASMDKLRRINEKFSLYNETANLKEAGNGLTDLLLLVGFWILYVLMLVYLAKVWELLRDPQRPAWRAGQGEMLDAVPSSAAQTRDADGEVCFMMPDSEDVEPA